MKENSAARYYASNGQCKLAKFSSSPPVRRPPARHNIKTVRTSCRSLSLSPVIATKTSSTQAGGHNSSRVTSLSTWHTCQSAKGRATPPPSRFWCRKLKSPHAETACWPKMCCEVSHHAPRYVTSNHSAAILIFPLSMPLRAMRAALTSSYEVRSLGHYLVVNLFLSPPRLSLSFAVL
jgi:hypothetical protein